MQYVDYIPVVWIADLGASLRRRGIDYTIERLESEWAQVSVDHAHAQDLSLAIDLRTPGRFAGYTITNAGK